MQTDETPQRISLTDRPRSKGDERPSMLRKGALDEMGDYCVSAHDHRRVSFFPHEVDRVIGQLTSDVPPDQQPKKETTPITPRGER